MDILSLVSLLVAVAALISATLSAYFGWQGIVLQRQAAAAEGIDFLQDWLIGDYEMFDEHGRRLGTETGRYLHLCIAPRGPGIRYKATAVVWGEADTEIYTPTQAVWGPESDPIELVVKKPARGTWDNIKCGLIWEVPAPFKKGFKVKGVRLTAHPDAIHNDSIMIEEWQERRGVWRMLRQDYTGKDYQERHGRPDAGAAHRAKSIVAQVRDERFGTEWNTQN